MVVLERQRLHGLDALRGVCLISMIGYHGLWNLVYLYGVSIPWYPQMPGYLWQQSICWTFIILSGFCWSMGRHPLKRGLMIFSGGILVSLVTHLLMPVSRITCGILTCTGSCVLLMIPLERLFRKIPAGWGAAGSLLLFVILRNCSGGELGFEGLAIAELPDALYRNLLTAYLGFPPRGFFSADYFPLLPWLGLFVFGYFLYRLFRGRGLEQKLFARGNFPLINWMGRHSLLVYLLHQPVLYGLCEAVHYLMK